MSFTEQNRERMSSLSPGPEDANTDQIAGDRRSDRRYDITLDLRWKLIRRRRVLDAGTGTTLDLSSSGILFETDRQLPAGLNIELFISWPVLLHNVSPLQLVVMGKIVRASGRRTAIRMIQHEFRTAKQITERTNVSTQRGASPMVANPRNPIPGKFQ
jgi:hypothetical protein